MARRILWLLLIAASTAFAQSSDKADLLYQALGAKPGIESLMDDFVNRLRADARIGGQFKDVKPAYLKQQLTDQICNLSGGPCAYEGESMAKAHASLKIKTADFNALVETLQDAMDAKHIPFSIQNQLLARLAPMHADVITVK
jgi:hemoglobin